MKLKICIICKEEKDFSECPKYSRKCTDCQHLTRCFKCFEVKETKENFKECNPGICRKCLNKIHNTRKKKKKSLAFIEKRRRASKKAYYKRTTGTPKKIVLSKKESEAIKRMRKSVHRLFKKWQIEKTKASFDYLDFTREEFLHKFPQVVGRQDIDHMIPMSWFRFDTPINIIFNIENLQLLDRIENRIKGNLYFHRPASEEYLKKALEWIRPEYLERFS